MPFFILKQRLFPGDRFTGSVVTLLSGAAFALLLSYLAQPILTRLYTPASFGLFDAFVSILGLLIPFASLRYEDALMLPEKEEEAKSILGLSLILMGLVSILSAGLWLIGPLIDTLSGSDRLSRWLLWIPPGLLVLRLTKLGELWLTRQKTFRTVASGQVAQSGVAVSLRIALGKVSTSSAFGLIAGYVAGLAASSIWYGYQILSASRGWLRSVFRFQGIIAAARRYRRFPIFGMPSTLLSAFMTRLPIILLLFFFDETIVGFYGRAFALLAVPLSLIGQAVSQVFFVEGVAAKRSGSLANLTRQVFGRLVMLGLFPAAALMFTGADVFGWVLGETWSTAGSYLKWVAPWFFLASVASPLTRIFDILEAQRTDMIVNLFMFLLQTGLLVIGGLTGDIHLCLLAMGTAGCLARIVHLGMLLKLARVSYRDAFADFARQGLYAAPVLGVLYVIQMLSLPWLTTLALVVGCLGFGVMFLKQPLDL